MNVAGVVTGVLVNVTGVMTSVLVNVTGVVTGMLVNMSGVVASSPGRQFKFRKNDGLVPIVTMLALAIT